MHRFFQRRRKKFLAGGVRSLKVIAVVKTVNRRTGLGKILCLSDGLAVEGPFELVETELLFLMLVFSNYDDLLQLAYNTVRRTN